MKVEYNNNDVNDPNYDEAYTLMTLTLNMEAAAKAINKVNDEEPDNFIFGQITIIVNSKPHAFILGGPQMMGLHLMIDHIIFENGYDIEEDDTSEAMQNMPCDTYGMLACGSTCPIYHECEGKKN